MTTTPALSDQQKKALDDILARLKDEPGPLFPILHAIQDELGWVPDETVPAIAKALNRSRAEIGRSSACEASWLASLQLNMWFLNFI